MTGVSGFVAIMLALAALPAAAQTCHPQGSATILTVVADGPAADRPGNTKLDQFVTHQEQSFGAARAYSADRLGALAQEEISFTLPYDGQRHRFSGPRVEAVLADAGAAGHGVTAQGIDGYHMDLSAADLSARHPILALCRDGQPLGIGDLGPSFLVFKPKADDKPDDEEFAHMVWGVYFLRPM